MLMKQEAHGLYTVINHLLEERIPVWYKLGSTKIPESLSQK